MSVYKLPSGRWRAQVHDRATGKNRSVGTYDTKAEAKAAREGARDQSQTSGTSVSDWRDQWLTDPLFARPKESTMIHNRERTKAFAERYGALLLREVGDEHVADWLAGGRRSSTVPALRAMWNDAMSAKAGRLVAGNPWAGLRLSKTRGNADTTPPTQATVERLVAAAADLCSPSLAAWLSVAAYTGMRPGELDALRWGAVDFNAHEIHVVEQWSVRARQFTLPKNGLTRVAILTEPARLALRQLPRDAEWVFPNFQGGHWTTSSRAYHWNAVRAAVGYDSTLYVATRHFAGWYMTNTLGLPSEDVAIALGHTDGGELVRRLYGHRDENLARERVRNAYASAPQSERSRPEARTVRPRERPRGASRVAVNAV